MVGVVLVTALLTAPPSADADVLRQAEDSFAEAVRLRDDPEKARPLFRRSADLFEELRRRGAANPALFRDQGNACLLADDLPGAILAYRRGLRLAPDDRPLQQFLAAAREKVVYAPQSGAFARPPVPSRPPWLPRLPVRGGVLLACAAYTFGWLGLARWWMLRRGLWLSLGLAAFAVTALLALAVAAEELDQRAQNARPLVVIARDEILLRKGNGAAYPRRHETPVNRGVEARLLFERGDWVQIELSGGETGWVPRQSALIDGP
ncbi:MAG TPA: SH3 domain-containing protein [Gemmataceae bacterium]|nr:SH3 domain-containing protein [Gemmataceae bacterium]